MKTMLNCFSAAAAVVLLTLSAAAPAAKAELTMDGPASFRLSGKVRYYSGGAGQGGRYYNLGADYYKRARLRIGAIDNHSGAESGDLSFEFWAMPYYGATRGVILMTTDIGWLEGDQSFVALEVSGYAISLKRRRFPEMNLWEYTSGGWRFCDAFTFTRKSRL